MSNLPAPEPSPRPPMQGGGCLIAAGLIFGPIIGLMLGETSAGLIGGLVIGVAAAIILTVMDKRR